MIYPNLEAVKALANTYSKIPVVLEMYMDFQTPIGLLSRVREKYSQYFLLESIEGGEKWARYTFLGFNPQALFYVKDGQSFYVKDGKVESFTTNPLDVLKGILEEYKAPKDEKLPSLTGGAVGYFGYETIKYIEDIQLTNKDELGADDIKLMFFDELIAFDHLKQKMILIVNIDGGTKDIEAAYTKAEVRLKELAVFASEPGKRHSVDFKEEVTFKSNMTKEDFMANVVKAKNYIENGDIFQVVPSQVFKAEVKCELFDVYRVLRTINPSPYMYLIKFEDLEIAGASPETLVKVNNGTIMTQPIAGSRPRGKTEEEDERLIKGLLADEKELAEHNMLVDLGRNDVGKISEFNSVQVSNYKAIKKFSHVIHITTSVSGTLKENFSSIDAIRSILPAGTLSGAPKVRAMEIIEELETTKRGIYGGGIGYIGYDGNLDTCIGIRTIVKKDGIGYVQAGGGVVLDSDPETEYEESVAKASAIFTAIKKVGEIL